MKLLIKDIRRIAETDCPKERNMRAILLENRFKNLGTALYDAFRAPEKESREKMERILNVLNLNPENED